ncbi:MAG: hypothetical protein J6P57_03330 [Lachnospiraceae bacterium]|nr:hypothetical protein [Lachnospiraceae bacterium]
MRKIFTKAVISSVVVIMGLSGCSSNKNEEKTIASETEAVTEEVLDEATIGDAAVSNEEEASSSDASDKVADASEMTTIEDVVEEGMVPIYANQIKDGVYDVEVSSSSSMFKIESCELTVKDGNMTAVMTMGGTGYLYLYLGTGEEASATREDYYIPYIENEDGTHSFEVSVEALDEGIACSAYSKKKEKWYDRTILFRADSLPMDAYKEGVFTTADSLGLKDGEYTVEVSLSGGSGKASIDSPAKIKVEAGKCKATIVWSSPNYDYMIVNGEKILPVNTDGNSTFEIPVSMFDRNMKVIADTTAMSEPHEIEYILNFDSTSIKE